MEGLGFWQLLFVAILLIVPILYHISSYFKYQIKMSLYYSGMFIIACFTVPYALMRPRHRGNHMFVKWCTLTFLSRLCGVQLTLRGKENLKDNQAAILCVNHQSSVDMIGMMAIWTNNCASMAKKELMYAGAFGLASWLCGTIFINRMNSQESRKTLDKTVEMIKAEKVKVVVFPEGTRNHGKELLPFKKGAFHLAVQAQVPVIPVVFSSYSSFYDNASKRFDEGHILIEILPAISTEGLSSSEDVTSLSERTRDIMSVCFNRISEEVETFK